MTDENAFKLEPPTDKKSAKAVNQEIIRKWFITDFWPRYPEDLCGSVRNKGSRGESIKAILTINPDAQERERILLNLDAQKRYDRKIRDSGEFVARWPACQRYLKNRRYDDMVGDISMRELAPEADAAKCSTPGCDQNVHGPRFKHCDRHLPLDNDPLRDARREKLRELNLIPASGESRHDYAMRCRDYLLKNYGGFLKTAKINISTTQGI